MVFFFALFFHSFTSFVLKKKKIGFENFHKLGKKTREKLKWVIYKNQVKPNKKVPTKIEF